MSQNNDTKEPDAGDFDPGPSIRPLAELEQEVSPQFLVTVRKKIYRRTTANQMIAFSWNLPKVLLFELILLLAHLFKNPRQEKV